MRDAVTIDVLHTGLSAVCSAEAIHAGNPGPCVMIYVARPKSGYDTTVVRWNELVLSQLDRPGL